MKKGPKIYDCFTFFNELDLLEIRLCELENVVDFFVIVEANKTHAGKNKEFLYEKNKERYKRWSKKIIYIKCEMPPFNIFDKFLIWSEKRTHGRITRFIGSNFRSGKWKLENFQREQIMRGLVNCNDSDIILISDLDEIPKSSKLIQVRQELIKNPSLKIGFRQNFFNHYLNGYVNNPWLGTKALTFFWLRKKYKRNTQKARLRRFHYQLQRLGFKERITILEDAGWHFNNIGRREEVLEKVASKAEADLIKKSKEQLILEKNYIGIEGDIKIVKLDKTFPKTIFNNKRKYAHLIKS